MNESKQKTKFESYYNLKKNYNYKFPKIVAKPRLTLSKNYSENQMNGHLFPIKSKNTYDKNIQTTDSNNISSTSSNFQKGYFSHNNIFKSSTPIKEKEISEENIDQTIVENYFINDFYNFQSKLGNNNNVFLSQKILDLNDIIGKDSKIPINFNILKQHFNNFSQGKISSKPFGLINSYAANTNQGINRNYNEDRVSIIINLNIPQKHINSISYFGIFDGHSGNKCAEFLRNNLLQYIYKNNNFPNNIPLAIKEAFIKADKDYIEKYNYSDENNVDNTGSCALILLIINEKIYIANCGDSRCIVSAKNKKIQKDVTRDHKPNYPYEKKRILNNGGKIYRNQIPFSSLSCKHLDINENHNLILGPYRVFPGKLSVSRTIGDAMAKIRRFGGNDKVIIPIPDIYVFDYNKDDIDFFILGCDGIFDQLTSKDVLKCANLIIDNNNKKLINNNENNDFKSNYGNIIDMNNTCGDIVDFIIKSSMVRKSLDNLTCIMVAFKNMLVDDNSIDIDNEECAILNYNNKKNNKIFEKDIKTLKINSNKETHKKEINKTEKVTNKKFPHLRKNVEIRKLMSAFNQSHSNINIHNNKPVNNKLDSNRNKHSKTNENLDVNKNKVSSQDIQTSNLNINAEKKNYTQILEKITNFNKKENLNTTSKNSHPEKNRNYESNILNTENNANCSKIHSLLKNSQNLNNIGIDFEHLDNNALIYLQKRKLSLNQGKSVNENLLNDKNKIIRYNYSNKNEKENNHKEFNNTCLENRVTFRKINRMSKILNGGTDNSKGLKTDIKKERSNTKYIPEIASIKHIFKRCSGYENK